jgi:uncharacterized phage protein (TIGR01671 family)
MIKFRVWDKIAHRMIYPGETVVDEMGDSFFIMIDSKGYIYEVYESPLGYYLEENTERYELMFWIGEKDKNGKDIYESDILRVAEQGMLIVEDRNFAKRFYSSNFGIVIFPRDKFEVIGNIYQNPELIPPDYHEEEN